MTRLVHAIARLVRSSLTPVSALTVSLCLTRTRAFGRLKVQKGVELALKGSAVLLVLLCATAALAQEAPTATVPPEVATTAGNPFVTLASEFFEHDYLNFYGFANGEYDSFAPVLQNGQLVNNSGSFGFNVGGGLNGRHVSADSVFSISYQGDYRDFQSSTYQSGTDQFLNLGYTRRLTRRMSVSVGLSGGTLLYGSNTFAPAAAGEVLEPNPFSVDYRFASAGVNLTYQQTRRLSFILGGSFFLQRYNYAGALGSTGLSGSASAQYRLTPRTTVGGSYSYSNFTYQNNAGNAQVQSISGTVTRTLPARFSLNLYGGVSLVSDSGTFSIPVTLLINGQPVSGYVVGPYHQTSSVPSFGGSLTKAYSRTRITVYAGQGVSAGNGFYLASRSDYVTGVASYGLRNSSISAGGSYSRLVSIANNISNSYTSADFSLAYSRNVIRYVSANLRYDYIRYGALVYNGVSDNRFTFGVSFSSKSVPLTLF